MPSVRLSPLFNGQTVTPAGAPAAGYKVYTYAAGSSSNLATYTTSAGTVAQPNPVILDANGFPENPIWLQTGLAYKLVLKDANEVTIRTEDNISGVNDASASVSQWQVSGVTPSYVSATSFTVPGDQTSEFHVGRRLQFTTNAGAVYGTILTSAYTALTTVTLSMDGTSVLDTGLSAVNLSLLRADNPAIPNGIAGAARVSGLTGNVNAATPLTKYDLSAAAVTMRNAAGGTITRYTPGAITCDLGLAGAAANGRDQAGAFAANSWVYLYFIWNGSTLATISSLSSTAPTLPTGYTHYALATALRWNASSNIVPSRARGAQVDYDDGVTALSNGAATVFTNVALSTTVPPIAGTAQLEFVLSLTSAAIASYEVVMRTAGASAAAGRMVCRARNQVASDGCYACNTSFVPLQSSAIEYKINAAPSTGGVFIVVNSYIVPNGDA